MYDYDFHSLNDKEFEQLSRDLLQCELGMTFESFKPGKDKGIDFKYYSPKGNEKIIIQVKHWRVSGLRKLMACLEKEELVKVKFHNPTRYILTTSVPLSLQNKETIKKLFTPFILSTSDIFGKDDINNLLGKFQDIESKHQKLWLPSTNVMQKIMQNGVLGRSEFTESNIIKNIELYVQNDKHGESLEILNNERFLIIFGEPGIGKTTLARMIIYQLLKDDYQLISVMDTKEAEDLHSPEKKQVFYFDDFLGANYLELTVSQGGDSRLVNFIKRVKEDPSKRLILTSRTTILNQAANKYPKLKDSVMDLSKYEVKINDYSKYQKALILYNHLYFNNLPDNYCEKIKRDKNYYKIINHKSFNPRIIEFIAEPRRLKDVDPENYLDFVLKNLDYPELIWEEPYEHGIDEYARFFLTTLFSLNNPEEKILEKAFEARLDYEILTGNFKRISGAFSLVRKDLLGSFVVSVRSESFAKYNFFNPSIADFLINYLEKNPVEKWRILESSIFVEQYIFRFMKDPFRGSIDLNSEELERLYWLISQKENTLMMINPGSRALGLLIMYYSLFSMDIIKNDITRLFEDINWGEVSRAQSREFKYLIEELWSHEWGEGIVNRYWEEIIRSMFVCADEKDEFDLIWELFGYYNKDYGEFTNNPDNKKLVLDKIEGYWDLRISDIEWSDEVVSGSSSAEKIENRLNDILSEGRAFNAKFGVETDIQKKINEIDVAEIASSNLDKLKDESVLSDTQNDDWKERGRSDREIDEKIDDLFS